MEFIIDRVTKQFKNKIAVDRVSLKMSSGIYGLLGANGAGKTTLLRMMAGVIGMDTGEISLDGDAVSSENYRANLGYLPQDFGYYPNFTAQGFLMYLAALKGMQKAQAKVKAAQLLELVHLNDVAKKKIKTFSGGMKQRLGIAQALLNNPKLLILDEPTAGLDPKERVVFRNMISRLKKDRIIFLSTHIVSDVEYIADEILVMKDGKIIHSGSLEEIIKVIKGKVWECKVERQEAEKLMGTYALINIREEKGGVFLRLAGEGKPCGDAKEVDAVLEDLYLYYFNEEGRKLI